MARSRKRTALLIGITIACLVLVGVLVRRIRHPKPVTINGAITVKDVDTGKDLPIADVSVTSKNFYADAPVKSDPSGFFSLTLHPEIRRGRMVTLEFRHPNYQPLDLRQPLSDMLWVVRLTPITEKSGGAEAQQSTAIGNIQVRYSVNTMMSVNVGSAVKSFQVENAGNVPCKGREPCSPDGRWKASTSAATLDAGPGNEFRSARVSCIAGPCPFTKIESDDFAKQGQTITATVRNWSDTTTFLMEAEVFHSMPNQVNHTSFPVIFGRALSFTLPASAEGVSIDADIDGETIIFPLGPALYLNWANCTVTRKPDQGKVFRCELKPGYRFK
jgi:hypothetical protein